MVNNIVQKKNCEMCGAEMENVYITKRFCDNCIRIRKNEEKRRSRAILKELKAKFNKETEQEKIKFHMKHKQKLTLGEIAKMAEAEHLTYGKFVAKYGL